VCCAPAMARSGAAGRLVRQPIGGRTIAVLAAEDFDASVDGDPGSR
jgi:hypothetical protein